MGAPGQVFQLNGTLPHVNCIPAFAVLFAGPAGFLVFFFFFNTMRKFSISVHVLLSTFPLKKPPKNQPKPNVVREMELST